MSILGTDPFTVSDLGTSQGLPSLLQVRRLIKSELVLLDTHLLREIATALIEQFQDFVHRESPVVDTHLIDGAIQVMVVIEAAVIEHRPDGVRVARERAHIGDKLRRLEHSVDVERISLITSHSDQMVPLASYHGVGGEVAQN